MANVLPTEEGMLVSGITGTSTMYSSSKFGLLRQPYSSSTYLLKQSMIESIYIYIYINIYIYIIDGASFVLFNSVCHHDWV